QEEGIGARPDEDVLAGRLRRPRAPRIDDHTAPAALAQRAQSAGKVGYGPETAVRLDGVGAEEQEEIRALDVRHRDRREGAEEKPRGELLRDLVDRAGAVDVARAQRA